MLKINRNREVSTGDPSRIVRYLQLISIISFVFCALPAYAQYSFQIVSPPGALFTQTFGINNAGKVVGNADDGVQSFRFVFDMKTGEYTVISDGFEVLEINNPGDMVGGVGLDCAIRDKNGGITTFFPTSWTEDTECTARGVNANGLVSGFEVDANTGVWLGFVYDPKKGTFEEFLPSIYQNIANGINAQGEVAGNVWLDEGAVYPGSVFGSYGYVRQPDGSVNFFLIDDSQSVPGRTRARGISESGLVTGFYADAAEGVNKSFVTQLSKGNDFETVLLDDDEIVYQSPCNPDVPPPPGDGWNVFTSVTASQVRNDGVVVGSCADAYLNEITGDIVDYYFGFIATPVK